MKILSYLAGAIALLLALYGIFFNRSNNNISVFVMVFFGLTWWLRSKSNL